MVLQVLRLEAVSDEASIKGTLHLGGFVVNFTNHECY